MKAERLAVSAILWFVPVCSMAQFSGFVSGSYGYNGNPLFTYEEAPDRMTQSYLELNFRQEGLRSNVTVGYVGGLTIYDSFAQRSYYEHRVTVGYSEWTPLSSNRFAEVEGEEGAKQDSTDSVLDLMLMIGARHDRPEQREYDNLGVTAMSSYRFMSSRTLHMRLTGEAGYRAYPQVKELSNLTGTVAWSIGGLNSGLVSLASELFAGVKHYTQALPDTARFETGVGQGNSTKNGKGQGKGKSGNGQGQLGGSGKTILVNAEASNSYQLAGGITLTAMMPQGSLQAAVLYRYNPGPAGRYLAQYASPSGLTEDLYNDYFSYQGPEARLLYRQNLLFGIRSLLVLEACLKSYGGPAVDLEGTEVAGERHDQRGLVELTLSRSFSLSVGADLEIAITASAMRNRSNDAFNDYSGEAVSLSLGVGF